MKLKIFIYICVSLVVSIGVYTYTVRPDDSSLRIHFFDVGQGDAALIRFRNGENMLVDCGPDKTILHKLGGTMRFKRTLEYLVISHFDADHYGGCIDVLARYEVKHIITNGQTKQDQLWRAWQRSFEQEQAEIKVIDRASDFVVASTTLSFLFPLEESMMSARKFGSNNASIVVRLVDNLTGTSVLFTGDLEEPGEKMMLETYCPQIGTSTAPCPALHAKVLKVGHHGSDTSSENEFLKAVAPDTAVISAGKHNSFGHPSLRIIKRLERLGVDILRTDKKGDILYSK